jgi:multicomponent Na+:H+ antiporter subunit G
METGLMETVLDLVSWVLLSAGGVFVLIGGIGALRMPNLYTRMHAASVTDTMGAALVLTGVMLQAGLSLATIKLAAILLFLLITSPTASYALASAALLAGIRPDAGQAADQHIMDGGADS